MNNQIHLLSKKSIICHSTIAVFCNKLIGIRMLQIHTNKYLYMFNNCVSKRPLEDYLNHFVTILSQKQNKTINQKIKIMIIKP